VYRIAEWFLNRGNAMLNFFAGFPGYALGNGNILGKCSISIDT